MKKYKHKQTGDIAELINYTGGYRLNKSTIGLIPKEYIENSNDWEEVIEIPEYVKCIRNNHGVDYGTNGVGRFFKVIGENRPNGSDYILEYDSKVLPSAFKERFIPATKEEYDNQFKDYEILSFKSSRGYYSLDPILNCYALGVDCYPKLYLGYILERPHIYTIHSVKRLSDSEVFQIGDKVDSTISDLGRAADLTRIKLENNKLLFGLRDLGFYPLSTLLKPKPPLLTTEDGVDVFEGDECYIVWTTDFKLNSPQPVKLYAKLGPWAIYFSTMKAAEAYLVCNKPCLSYVDVANTLAKHDFNLINGLNTLREQVKSRLGIKP